MYELGTFWNDNADLQSLCADNLNSTWWSNADSEAIDVDDDLKMESFVSDHGVHSDYRFSSGTAMLMLSGVVVMALLAVYTVMMRKRKKILMDAVHAASGEATDYGAV